MRLTQAVVWREPDGIVHSGKLELTDERLELSGSAPGGALAAVRIPYDELAGVRIGRSPADRVNGGPSLVLERRSAPPIHVSAVASGGILETADVLAGLIADRETATRIAVVVPIRRGTRERAEALVDQGPPFDPEQAPFRRHHVFVTDREVVFLFEGRDVRQAAERLLRDPSVWKAAAAWRGCLAGAPRVADERYGWNGDAAA